MRLGQIDHCSPYRVELDVAHDAKDVGIGIDQAGFVASLPERADASMALVECLHVGLSDGAHGTRDGTGLCGMQQQVHMVVHQHVGVNEHVVLRACLAQEAPVVVTVLVVEEDRASVHPSLGDMHGNAGNFDSGLAWHRADLVGMLAVSVAKLPADIGEMPVRR